MADLNRLVEDPELTPLARSVLRSSEDDGPSARSRARIARGLGLTAAAIAGTEAGAQAAATAGLAWWKLSLIVFGLAGASATAYVATRGGSPSTPAPARPARVATGDVRAVVPRPAPASAAAIEPAPAPAAPAPAPAPAATARSEIRTAPAHRPARRAGPAPAVTVTVETAPAAAAPGDDAPASTGSRAAGADAPAVLDARRLAAEVALVDAARAQLRRGAPGAALTTLARHDREFPDGVLAAEATLVRIEAHDARGDHAAAAALARRFLTRFPTSPLAPRARAVLDRAAGASR